jgi:TetR/AcrR family transcriptional repressor of nem operon
VARVSKATAAEHRGAITEAAGRLFRERGIDAVSVADLMGAAGLTHGGFYGHFPSKSELAAEACSLAFEQSTERWKQRSYDARDLATARAAIVEGYLSSQSRGAPGTSCPASSLLIDVARAQPGDPLGEAFGSGVEALIEVLASLQATGRADRDREQAMGDLATMVGALALARATAGQSMSDAFLQAGRRALLAPGEPVATRRSRQA